MRWYCCIVKTTLFQTLMAIDEQLKMNDCYYDKKDWRLCRKEVSAVLLLSPNRRVKMPRGGIKRLTPARWLTRNADGAFQRMLEAQWQRTEDAE